MPPDSCAPVDQVYATLALVPPLPPGRRAVLVIMTGLPGSGKTHLARLIAAALPLTIVSSDAVRALLFPQAAYTTAENRAVFDTVDALLWRLLRERRHILYDAVNLSEMRRETLRRLAYDAGACPLTVLTTAPPDVIRARLEARTARGAAASGESQADYAVYRRLAPRAERVAHQHITVDTTADLAPALARILAAIDQRSQLPG